MCRLPLVCCTYLKMLPISLLLFIIGCVTVSAVFFYPCVELNGITEAEANAVMENWPDDLNLATVNRTHKCYVSCILVYFGILDTSAELTLDKYFDSGVIDEYAVASALNQCRFEYKDEKDLCERTFGIFNCLRIHKLYNL